MVFETLARVLLVVVSTTVSLFVGDALIALTGAVQEPGTGTQPRSEIAAALGRPFDSRKGPEVLSEFRAKGVDAQPIVTPSMFLPTGGTNGLYPLSGVPGVITVHCNEDGSWSNYLADHLGFKNPDSVWQLDRAAVVLVGDSFTHGACVGMDDDIAGRLRRAIPGVVNLGMSGSGPLIELAILREYAAALRPKVLVWVYFADNDGTDLALESRDAILTKYLVPEFSQNLRSRTGEIETATRAFAASQNLTRSEEQRARDEQDSQRWLARSTEPLKILRLWHVRMVSAPLWKPVAEWLAPAPPATLASALTLARDEVRSWGGEMLFVYLSNDLGITGKISKSRILRLVNVLGIESVDFNRVLRDAPDPMSYYPLRTPAHFSAVGYGHVADAILRTAAFRTLEGADLTRPFN